MSKNSKVTKDLLLDFFEATGTTFEGMYEYTSALDEITKVIEMPQSQVSIFTLTQMGQNSVNGVLHEGGGNKVVSYTYDELRDSHGATPELIGELKNNSMMLFDFNGYVFFTTHEVLGTLSQRGGSRLGDADFRPENNLRLARNMKFNMYMCLPEYASKRCRVVYREVDGAKKVLGVFTERFAPIPQTESIKFAVEGFEKELGKADLKWWRVNATDTQAYMEFPEQRHDFTNVQRDAGVVTIPDDVTPGILIRTADGGDASFTVIGTIKVGKTIIYVPAARYMRAHTKNVDVAKIGEALEKQVFGEFKKIPNRLCELLAIDVPYPVDALNKIAKFCGIKKILGLGTENEVIRNIEESLNPNVSYTAYDLAMMFLDEGRRLENEKNRDETIGKIRNCFVQAIFFKYEGL